MRRRLKPKKSWREKLMDDKDLPRVIKISGKMSRRWGTGTVAIPAPREVDALMKKVRKGKVTTINDIRSAVARKHCATIGCPITCGIFAWIAANAAAEEAAEGRKRITPYWRTLKTGGFLNEKYPGGTAAQKRLLESEGHKVVRKGKRHVVADLDKCLATL
jgi:alkylated DNA nucleotide flippase Atl1